MREIETNKTLYKSFVVENYYDDYYENLKKSLPKKIHNGEIEWIYSYGDKLIKSGEISVLQKVMEIVKTKECDNPYIKSDLLYKKCVELKRKFWWKSIFCKNSGNQVSNINYSLDVSDAIRNFLKNNNFSFEFYEEVGIYVFGVSLNGKIKSLSFWIQVEQQSYNISAVLDGLEVTEEKVSVVSEFIHRLNDFCHICQLKIVDGLIGCWQSVNCQGIVLSNEFIGKTYTDIIFCVTELCCGLVDVIEGKTTPKEFFENYKKVM